MRILKYIFLLILLAFFALSVFVATQKGDFAVERSKIIKSPKATVFNYINDYRNWENFGSWKTDDPKMEFIYPQNTVGKGGSYSWKGTEGNGNVKTTAVIDNESIRQKMDYGGTVSEVNWTFKDTLGGTKVTWKSKGNMSFGFKIYSAFNGGADKVIGTMYERSLANLDKSLDYEINTYTIKVDGIVTKTSAFYLQQRITSKISNVSKNLRIMLPKLIYFFRKNKIPMYGKPFVVYHTYDMAKGITDMSVCIPVDKQIFISPGSDISSGKLQSFKALKTTLTGDYSHLQQAWDKAFEYMDKNNILQNEAGAYVELYAVNMEQEKHPSKWVTAVYIPVKSKEVAPVWKPKPTPVIIPVETAPATEVPEP
ncbi:MAG TPA: SRPBCC family protein [Flavobacterium sp.]|nr:SRPBCC family protein [Flavobacterium sp.]